MTARNSSNESSSGNGSAALEQITRFERDWFERVRHGAIAELAGMLPKDYTFISSEGQLLTSEEAFRRLKAIEFTRLRVGEMTVRNYGNVVVLVTQLQINGSMGQQDVSGDYTHTRVYVRREGQWTPVSGQSTRNYSRRGAKSKKGNVAGF